MKKAIRVQARLTAPLLRRESFDLVISDLKLPGRSGLELFRATRQDPSPPQFVFLTAFGTVEEAVALYLAGKLATTTERVCLCH